MHMAPIFETASGKVTIFILAMQQPTSAATHTAKQTKLGFILTEKTDKKKKAVTQSQKTQMVQTKRI